MSLNTRVDRLSSLSQKILLSRFPGVHQNVAGVFDEAK